MTASPCASRTLAILGPRARFRGGSRLGPDAGGERRRDRRRRGRCRRPLSLAGLRAALLRDDGQLYGPSDPLAVEADPRQRAQVDQRPVRDGQRGLSGGLRGGPALLRRAHRSRRDQDRVRGLHLGLEPGRHGARARGERERLLRRAHRARARRGGKLPLGHQGGGHLVPAPGAGLRHRALQQRQQRGRHHRAGGRPLDGPVIRLALGVRGRRDRRARLAGVLAPLVRGPRAGRQADRRRAGSHPQPGRGRAGRRRRRASPGRRSCATVRPGRSSSPSS